jgi:hypothetical protein
MGMRVSAWFLSCALGLSSTQIAYAAIPTSQAGSTEPDAKLQAIRHQLPDFKRQLDDLRGKGQDISYPLVTYTVLDHFTSYALEELGIVVPSGWGLTSVNGAGASSVPVHDAHTGQWAIKIANRTPQQPNVYGMLESQDVIALKAGQPYTLSLWSKSQNPGGASMTLNAAWTLRLPIAGTGGQWKRFGQTFTPSPADVAFKPRVLIESVGEFVIDDVCLVEGATAEQGRNLITNGSFEFSWNEQRVSRELPDMEEMTDRLARQLTQAEAARLTFPTVPRWDGSQRPSIEGPSFVGLVRIGDKGVAVRRPIFFVGYGHFDQVRQDIDHFPGYGINIVQHAEFGPIAVYPSENQTDDSAITRLSEELDRAAKAGLAVDWLLSPHYVPEWLIAKYPALRKPRADFFPFSVYAPQPRDLIRRFVHEVVARIKDKPALLSICLSNEPINCEEPDALSTAAWRQWLKTRHGDITTLNSRWGTTYASFDQIPQPNPLNRSAEPRPGGAWCDFCRWNDEYFADFHRMLADAVHEVAPRIPVHIKVTTPHLWQASEARTGDDAGLFGRFTQINGNDSINLWSFDPPASHSIERGDSEFAQGWRENAIGYELERSTHDAPVFNSENHLIFDREPRYVPPAHVRAALWMGAIHGQSATTLWVWQREKSNPQGDFAGDFIERPSCAEAVGIVCHDLNRAAPQITALQNAPPDVLILQSMTAAVWDGARYDSAFLKTYTALSFTGVKIGFLAESELERDAVLTAPLLIVPDNLHLSDKAFAALASFKGKVIFASADAGDLLSRNEYDRPSAGRLPQGAMLAPLELPKTWQALLPLLRTRLMQAGVMPTVQVLGPGGTPQSGVQWQLARTPQGLVVNLYNAGHDTSTITISPSAPATDRLTGETLPSGAGIRLASMEVRLLVVADPR